MAHSVYQETSFRQHVDELLSSLFLHMKIRTVNSTYPLDCYVDYIIHIKCLTELVSQFVLYITRRLFPNENLLSDFENLHTQAIRKMRVAGKKQKQILDTLP